MSLLSRLSIVVLLASFPIAALAAEPAKDHNFRSFTSSITCEQAVKSLEKKEGMSDFALLVSAFITGTNYVKNRDSQLDLKGMMVLTEQYCRQNPKQPVTTALIVLDRTIDQRLAQQGKAGTAQPAAQPATQPAPAPAGKPAKAK